MGEFITRMIERRLGRVNEKGFTLIEMVAVIGIVGIISGVTSMSIIMIMKVSAESNDQTVALQRVQNSGQWLSIDVQMAQTIEVDTNPDTETFITLTIPVAGEADNTIIYKLENVEGTNKKLTRTDQNNGTIYLISDYIYYDPLGNPDQSTKVISFDEATRKLIIRITAVSGITTASKQYQVTQRINAVE